MDQGSKNERIEFGSNDREKEGPQVLYWSIENKHVPMAAQHQRITKYFDELENRPITG